MPEFSGAVTIPKEVIMSKLLEPLAVGELELPNRVVMAPLTRNRATMPGRVPNGLMRDYYVQRASAGMILTEATSVEPLGVGYPSTPGIWSQDQVGRAGVASRKPCTTPVDASCCSCGTSAASLIPGITMEQHPSRRARSRPPGT